MSDFMLALALIAVGITVAYLANQRYHNQARALESCWRIPFNIAWATAGGFMILGGYYAGGLIFLIGGLYFFFANTARVRKSSLRQDIANWRPFRGNS